MTENQNTARKGSMEVRHNEAKSRFEASTDGQISLLAYREAPSSLVLFHTEVPSALRGQGIASALARTALEFARSHALKVAPLCPFVAGFLKEHPEYADLVEVDA